MTRPILHRQVIWTDAKAYAPDLYASLAAVTLPDSGQLSRRFLGSALLAPFRGTVARKATDLSWANASHRAGRASPEPQERLGHTATIAFAIDALMWAVFAGCFLLIVSGSL